MTWLFELLGLLARTSVALLEAKARGASAAELVRIGSESAIAQGALLAQQEITLSQAERDVPGFHKD